MPTIKATIDKYANSMELVKLTWRRLRELNSRIGTDVNYSDPHLRDVVRGWNLILRRKYHDVQDEYLLFTLVSEIFAELIFEIYASSSKIIKPCESDRAEVARRVGRDRTNPLDYIYEYISIDIVVAIIFETHLSELLDRPSHEKVLEAARMMRDHAGPKTDVFVHLGLSELLLL